MTEGELIGLVAAHGLWVIAPLAVLEGPVVSILTGWLVSLSILNPYMAFAVLLVGDVVGDALLYAAGRGARLDKLPLIGPKLRLPRAQMVGLVRGVREHGVRLLVLGKLTHAAGFAVLIAAGAARMNFALFLLVNTLTSIPKTLAFLALGYLFGHAHERIADWLQVGSGVLLAVIAGVAALVWFVKRRAPSCQP